MTHQRIADPTRGMMGVLPANKPPAYKLALNEYWLVLSNDPNNHDQLAFADVNNNTSTPNKIKIGILQESEFNSLHNNLVQRIAKKSTENAKKIGKVPYLVPEDKLGPANVR